MKFPAPVFDSMPKVLTERHQWVMWREVMKPLAAKPSKLPFTVWGLNASTTDPHTWNTFEAVKAAYWAGGFDGVGFVFATGGNLSGIDLDDPNGDQDKIALFNRITDRFDTYTENSPSGKGVHIITFGEVESGKRRDGVECYSSGRFFTMTGNLTQWPGIPVKGEVRDCRAYLEILWRQLGGASAILPPPVSKPERVNDDDLIIELCALPHAGELFKALMRGEIDQHNNDHSAADQALCNIIANSTDNLEQVERIWGKSELAKRPKWNRRDYRRWTVNKSFDLKLDNTVAENFAKAMAEQMQIQSLAAAAPLQKPVASALEYVAPEPKVDPYIDPPGLLGDIARFIYWAAPYPVREIALVGAIGYFAGIVGRQYNVSGTGLNQYINLVAPTGTGKDAIKAGIALLNSAIALDEAPPDGSTKIGGCLAVRNFTGPGSVSSYTALRRTLETNPCFHMMLPEFGLFLKSMTGDHVPHYITELMRGYLDMYSNSGRGQYVGAGKYAKKEDNFAGVANPALTLIGECTPETFYPHVDEALVSHGFLPRWITIEYRGKRVQENEQRVRVPDQTLVRQLRDLVAYICTLMIGKVPDVEPNHIKDVPMTLQAEALFRDFERFCTAQINANNSEASRQLWNRAKLKAMKLAALVAVGCHWFEPTITLEHAQWAKRIIVADIDNLLGRFDAGDTGSVSSDVKQQAEVKRMIALYYSETVQEAIKYGSNHKLFAAGFVPMSYLNKRLVNISAFKKTKQGTATNAINQTVKALVDNGELFEMPLTVLKTQHSFSGKAYGLTKVNF